MARTDVDTYSFVNRTIKGWNQLPAGLLASFPCKLARLERGLRMLLQAREFKWRLSVNKWSDAKWSDVGWTDIIYVKWFYFEVKCSEVSYVEVLGDKSTMCIRVTLGWRYFILWLFNLGVSCTVVVLTCFVVCGFVYVWVL